MNLKKNHYSRRALALLLTLVMCVGMIPTAFAAQQNSYHDPAEHWMQASGRTNELDANSVVTRETFKCGECGKATSFEVFRVPEYTRNGQPALSRNVKYSDGTMVDGVGKGDTMDGIPGKDATYTGYHYTKAVCETCGSINTNMGLLTNPMYHWKYDIMKKEQWGDGNATKTAHGNDRRSGPGGTLSAKTGSHAGLVLRA